MRSVHHLPQHDSNIPRHSSFITMYCYLCKPLLPCSNFSWLTVARRPTAALSSGLASTITPVLSNTCRPPAVQDSSIRTARRARAAGSPPPGTFTFCIAAEPLPDVRSVHHLPQQDSTSQDIHHSSPCIATRVKPLLPCSNLSLLTVVRRPTAAQNSGLAFTITPVLSNSCRTNTFPHTNTRGYATRKRSNAYSVSGHTS